MQVVPATNINLVLDPSFELLITQPISITSYSGSFTEAVMLTEFVFVKVDNANNPVAYDLVRSSESLTVAVQDAFCKPTAAELSYVTEIVAIQLVTPSGLAGWIVGDGATLIQTNSVAYVGNYSAELISSGPAGYLAYTVECLPGTAFVAQAEVKGTSGKVVDLVAYQTVEDGLFINSRSISASESTTNIENVHVVITATFAINISDFSIVTDTPIVFLNFAILKPAPTDSVTNYETISIQTTGPNNIVATSNVTLDGNWDLLALPSFTTDAIHYVLTIEIYPTTSTTIYVDAVIVQLASNAYPGYFDGNSGIGFSWAGAPNASTSLYTAFTSLSTANAQSRPSFGILIDWTRALNPNAGFFTINQSSIGGGDFMPGTQTYPTYTNSYSYVDYSPYMLNLSIAKDIGLYTYGSFSTQMTVTLDNTSLIFSPGLDPTIGSYILPQRPVQFSLAYGGSSIMLFAGATTKPINDLQNRTVTLIAFDSADYLNMFVTAGAGPIAAANNGLYLDVPADQIIADLLAEAGFLSNQYVLDQSLQATPIGYLAPIGYTSNDSGANAGTIGAIISDICEAEAGYFSSMRMALLDSGTINILPNYLALQGRQTWPSVTV